MIKSEDKEDKVLKFIQSLDTIRIQAQRMLNLAREGRLEHFLFDESKMAETVDFVLEVIKSQYPTLAIPYHSRWRHFEAGGIDRINKLTTGHAGLSSEEWGKIRYELVILSVLLDAGAGKFWHYRELESDQVFSRSEGLAVASLVLYQSGALSKVAKEPLRIDAEPLLAFNETKLRQAFQVSQTNPLAGLQGRVALINRLGEALKKQPRFFGEEGRLGNFYQSILSLQNQGQVAASQIFQTVLRAFHEIWPQRQYYQGFALGDVWSYPQLGSKIQPGSELVPFHKLSQWLTYSLIEPLEEAGFAVSELEALTGLPEYRNGGLLIDMGLLQVKDKQILQKKQKADSTAIIEWRALTVAVLDELATAIRRQLGMNARELPLAKILQGGTWEAGRRIARQKRHDGAPPIEIISDGTVF